MENNRKIINEINFIKCFALILVFTLHYTTFISNITKVVIDNNFHYFQIIIFIISQSCVPLFFLCSGVTLHKITNYKIILKHIFKIILMYLFAVLICYIYTLYNQDFTKINLYTIIKLKATPYDWYLRYYLLLILLVPVINKFIWQIPRKYLYLLLLLLMILNIFGTMFRYSDAASKNMIIEYFFKILKNIFPFVYYLLGYVIYERMNTLKKYFGFIVLFFCTFTIINSLQLFYFYRSRLFYYIPNGYGGWNIQIISCLLFIIIFMISSKYIKNYKIINEISKTTLIAYTISAVTTEWFKISLKIDNIVASFILFLLLNIIFSVSLGIIGSKICGSIVNKLHINKQ